jgi:hypothetical protein
MAVKLTHLQLIYGVAGAREKFEDLAVHLIRSERPDAGRVRIVHGDGGIDAHEGSLADPGGVDVFQIKFFPDGVGDSQKAQIRDSFKRTVEATAYKARTWTLCVPIDLSIDERTWFDGWRAKQAGVAVTTPWDATRLEGLLYEPRNRGIKEEFFKEEYLRQIRESHGLIQKLLEEIDDRLPRQSPLVLDTKLGLLRVGKAHVFDDAWAVLELEVPIEVHNNNPQSVSNWYVKNTFRVDPLDRFVTRESFPRLSPGRLHAFNRTILPTLSKESQLNTGLKVKRSEPLELQMLACLRCFWLRYHLISDNHVGDEKEANLSDLILWPLLILEAKRALQEADISYTD